MWGCRTRDRCRASIGPRCRGLRVRDEEHNWRVFYRIDPDIILVFLVFAKKTSQKTPKQMIDLGKKRLKDFDARELGAYPIGERTW